MTRPLRLASLRPTVQIHRALHSRNKKAMEYIGKGWDYLQEVERVIDYTYDGDELLAPILKNAKRNFELALEVDNLNTQARLWLARMHLKYDVPGACKAVGAALLVEAADMGNADAQYELGCQLRIEGEPAEADYQAFYYLEKAVEQLQPEALFLLGAVYIGGDCVKKDLKTAAWCFHKATQKGHVGAAIAYGSLVLKGVRAPEKLVPSEVKSKFTGEVGKRKCNKLSEITGKDAIDYARRQFEVAAHAGNGLAFKWLYRLQEEEIEATSSQGKGTEANG